jgi:hypothetical protein
MPRKFKHKKQTDGLCALWGDLKLRNLNGGSLDRVEQFRGTIASIFAL